MDNKKQNDTLPQGNALTNRDEHYRNNMHEVLDRIRDTGPAYKDNVFQRWVVTNHQSARDIFKNIAGCGRDWEVAAEGTWGKTVSPRNGKFGMVDEDGEKHRRLRSLVSKTFLPTNVEPLRPMMERIADELINKVKHLKEFDFMKNIAAPFPTIVMAEILGVAKEDQAKFKQWSDEWVYICDPDITPEMHQLAMNANQSLVDYFNKTVYERSLKRENDLISKLIHDGDESERLTLEEVATMCLQLIVAGNITSADLIGNGIVALLNNPEEMKKLRANPELIHQASEEMLRFDPPVTEIPRFCYEDISVEGMKIEKGQTITLNLAGSNRDPKAYECPHQFKVDRKGPPHHAFGGGAHNCLGIHLARLEIEIIFRKVLAAFPTLKLVDQELVRKAIPTFSGYKQVLVSTQ
jgi:cytochrome P450